MLLIDKKKDNLDSFLKSKLFCNETKSLAIVNDLEECTWQKLSILVDDFIQNYSQLININKQIPLIIYGHKEIQFVVAIYACLLLKIPFVPVDDIYPEQRLNNIAAQSNAKYIYHSQNNKFEKYQENEVVLVEKDVAYILFTSGTTGNPKGVQIGRESVENLINWMYMQLDLSKSPIFMNQAPFCFDLSMYEIFGNLAYNGCIVMGDRNIIKDSEKWLLLLNKYNITTWVSTPSFVTQQLFNKNFNENTLSHIKEFLFCGEKLGKNIVKKLIERFPSARIINSYGPTEATVATTYIDITKDMLNSEYDLPVGYPILNSDISIINNEIVISGNHVMRGYLNNEIENQKKLKIENDIRSFYTGDIGFFENNILYCLGRNDDQIKFNGFRIDINEIEEKVLSLNGFNIKSCAVIPLKKSDGSILRMIAYYNTNNGHMINIENIKEEILNILPIYMLPSEFIYIENIPVTNNHKVDKKSLLEIYLNEVKN